MGGLILFFIFGGIILLYAIVKIITTYFVRIIPNNQIGILERRIGGSIKTGFIALSGEAGFQPQVLRGGIHTLMPFRDFVHTAQLVTIPQGKMGYVFARDGQPLGPNETLATNVNAKDFQDVESFLRSGGKRGPQRQVLRDGTYAINLAQFMVFTEEKVYYLPMSREDEEVVKNMSLVILERDGYRPIVIKDSDDMVGIVTVHDGPSMPQGELIAPVVGDDSDNDETYHNNFQDADRFLMAGGVKGRQLQTLVEGTYYINRLFATVEMIPKTTIEVGWVGVVVSYTGASGEDLSGADYKHGELAQKGNRGVWSTPLMPGKYAFNTYAGKVITVPTTNIILKWNRRETGSHKFDENLAEISLITKDAFEPSLPLSVVVHIDYRKAPLVIQRFGDIKKLVEQTLDPMVAAYFKNIGQTRTLIQLLQDRSSIQQISSEEMKEKFAHYNLELEEVLIGTPTSSPGDNQIENILTQLRSRQIAEEQVETYSQQEKASQKERELREAQARAGQQQIMTESELSITVETNKGKAEYQKALQQANQIKALAEAEAERIRIMAEAEAEKVARIGIAQAMATEEQVRAYGGPQFQVMQQVMNRFAEAIEIAHVDVVPKIIFGGSGTGQGGSGNLIEGLIGMFLSDKLSEQLHKLESTQVRDPQVEAYRQKMKQSITDKSQTGTTGAVVPAQPAQIKRAVPPSAPPVPVPTVPAKLK